MYMFEIAFNCTKILETFHMPTSTNSPLIIYDTRTFDIAQFRQVTFLKPCTKYAHKML